MPKEQNSLDICIDNVLYVRLAEAADGSPLGEVIGTAMFLSVMVALQHGVPDDEIPRIAASALKYSKSFLSGETDSKAIQH